MKKTSNRLMFQFCLTFAFVLLFSTFTYSQSMKSRFHDHTGDHKGSQVSHSGHTHIEVVPHRKQIRVYLSDAYRHSLPASLYRGTIVLDAKGKNPKSLVLKPSKNGMYLYAKKKRKQELGVVDLKITQSIHIEFHFGSKLPELGGSSE